MREVVEAIDFIMGDVLFLPVRKALNPNNPRDFLVISRQLQQAVSRLSGAAEADALRQALDTLDVDWASMKPAARDKVVDAARIALAKPAQYVAPKVEETFTVFGHRIVGDTKKDAKRKYKLDISVDLNANDANVINDAGSSQANFVRDQYGKRSEDLSAKVRSIVSSGLDQGLGSSDIFDRIKDHLGESANARSDAYWGMITMTFANRARTYGNLSGYANGGIDYFRFEAVMDERTSDVCRLMHGRRFRVAKALDRYKKVERSKDPEAVYDVQPWLRVSGGQVVYEAGGKTKTVAHMDDAGNFSKVVSDAKLEAAGITTPPLHGNCRSTIIPEEGDAEEPVTVAVPEQIKPPPPKPPEPPPPPPEPPKPPVITPKGLQLHLADAFGRFQAAPSAASMESMDAQADIRQGMRDYLDNALGAGAQSADITDGRPEAHAYDVLKSGLMGYAAAQHNWNGKVDFSESTHNELLKAMKLIKEGRGNELDQYTADAVRTLFHEELHGYSRGAPMAYKGIGVGMEEAQTEILARKMARGMLGEAAADPAKAKHWALPAVKGTFQAATTSGGYGSYQNYIGTILARVAQAGVPPKQVGKVVEDTFTVMLKYKAKAISGEEQVDRFVGELEKAGHITKESGATLRAQLKDPKGGMSP